MAVYPIHEGFIQPLQPEQTGKIKTTKESESLSDLTESEGEPAPCNEGDFYESAEEVTKAVETAYKNDKNLQTKLIKYADRKVIEIMGGKNDGRMRPDDVVEEAVFRILNLNRKWYKNKVTKIENLILMVIVSLIRIEAEKIMDIENQLFDEREQTPHNTGNSMKKNKRRIIPLYFKDEDGRQSDNTIIDNEVYKHNDRNKYEDNFNFEILCEDELISNLEVKLEEDENAFFVLQEILDGNKSNIDIAGKLGIEVKEVENARKRIKRKATNLTAK